MRGVAEDHHLALVVPGAARDREEGACRVRKEVLHQGGHQLEVVGSNVREILLKEADHIFLRLQLVEILEGHKERARERTVLIRQTDQHELVPGPDVQCVGKHGILPTRQGRDRELFVPMIDVLPVEIQPHKPPQFFSHARKCAIGPDHKLAILCVRLRTDCRLEVRGERLVDCSPLVLVDILKPCVEGHLDVAHLVQLV
mmetsp:Transcript_43577/g.106564  ORF Transcript_43577/g.106564 Transcript_43577/m.106564 type:complete len:200 (-) Transcript_43577:339-938(-)